MQFHSNSQKQALTHLEVQYKIAISTIKNNVDLSIEDKQKAIKEATLSFKMRKKKLLNSLF